MVKKLVTLFTRRWYWYTFFVVLMIAAALRLYKLGDVPHGMTWDEAAIGYNGYAVLTTRRDEAGIKLPISFHSFGDYKAPLAIYIDGPFTFLFGMNAFAVRLPFAIAGVLAVAGFMLLVKELTRVFFPPGEAASMSLLAGTLLTFSPWHLHFSRIGFESGITQAILIWAVYFFCRLSFSFKNASSRSVLMFSLATFGLLSASFYAYHSAKLFTPLIVVTLTILLWQHLKKHLKEYTIGLGFGLLTSLPFIVDSFFGKGGERFGQATIFGDKLALPELLATLIQNFFQQFSWMYLAGGETTTLRHGDGMWGVLFPVTLVTIVIGCVLFFLQILRGQAQKERSKFALILFCLLWIIFGSIPAAIGKDVPHANRGFFALPGYLLLAVLAYREIFFLIHRSKVNAQLNGSKEEKDITTKSYVGSMILLYFFSAFSYLHHYFTVFPAQATADFQDGYQEVVEYVKSQEASVSQILFTSKYGQPYIYVLFGNRVNPINWDSRVAKYRFVDEITIGDFVKKNTLLVATPEEIAPEKGEKVIYGANGTPRFVIVRTEK